MRIGIESIPSKGIGNEFFFRNYYGIDRWNDRLTVQELVELSKVRDFSH